MAALMSHAQVTIPLGIPDVWVLQTSMNDRGEIIITIESTKDGMPCRKCGSGSRSCMSRMSGSPSDTYRYLAGRVFCAIDPSGVNFRNVRVNRPRRKAWNGMIPTARRRRVAYRGCDGQRHGLSANMELQAYCQCRHTRQRGIGL